MILVVFVKKFLSMKLINIIKQKNISNEKKSNP